MAIQSLPIKPATSFRVALCFLLFLGACVSCAPGPTIAPAAPTQETPPPTPTVPATPSALPTIRATATPSPSPHTPTATPCPTPECPASTPPTGQIVFLSPRSDTNGDGQIDLFDQSDAYAINVDGSGLHPVESSDPQADLCHHLSPDGEWQVISSLARDSMQIARTDGSLDYDVSLDLDWYYSWAWSPDSEELAVGGGREEEAGMVVALYRVSREGELREVLLEERFALGEWSPLSMAFVGDMHWSTDGLQVFFDSPYRLLAETARWDTDAPIPWELYRIDLDTGELFRYDSLGALGGLSWSPDDQTILFSTWSWRGAGGWELWLVDVEGTNPRPLGGGGFMIEPWPDVAAFSPDGCWVVFATAWDFVEEAYLGEDTEIYVVRIDGAHLQQVTDNDYFDRVPRWIR